MSDSLSAVPGRRAKRAQRGFTLIEMIVVVAIIVLLAGFLLPKLDDVMLRQNKGVAAGNMGGLNRYIQTYRIMHNLYPDKWDSLLDTTGALVVPGLPGEAMGLDPQLVGGPPAGSPTKLTTVNIASDEHLVRSIARMGITRFYDAPTTITAGKPNDIFDTERVLVDTSTPFPLATISSTDEDGNAIIRTIYKYSHTLSEAQVQAAYGQEGSILVVLGFDRKNNAVGEILAEAPTYSNTADPQQYYNRLLAVFKVSKGGSRASLAAVLGADGDQIHEEIADYYEK